MEVSLAPEVEARLARIASEAGKAADQVVQELVADYLDHDEWFRREVQKGLASLDDGKFVSRILVFNFFAVRILRGISP